LPRPEKTGSYFGSFPKGRGRPRKFPRLKVRNTPAVEVRNILTWSPVLRKVSWERYHVKDGTKGPMVWEARRIPFWIKDENGLPSRPHHLMVTRNVLKERCRNNFLI
jgi:hypothetical protein